jgi:hypothetical protein
MMMNIKKKRKRDIFFSHHQDCKCSEFSLKTSVDISEKKKERRRKRRRRRKIRRYRNGALQFSDKAPRIKKKLAGMIR